ncbi:uncharacterized protein LOC135212109 [Macrobrachium nipponense]|uniref:uncharacterized protein LOC135212109 n=1 Tax=Macrobrachium nipponense TaxID=159736 RepID=UPI0030C8C4CD
MEGVRFLRRLKYNLIQIAHRKMSCFGRTFLALLYICLPVSTPVLQPDDHYALRYRIALERVVKPVMHKVYLLLRPKSGKSKDHLFALNRFSQIKYKKTFNVSQRRKLDNDESSEGFDISLLYLLLQHVCGLADTNDSKWRTPGTLENSLTLLKNHRNTSAHEDISFTFGELQKEIKDMEELCKSVLIAAGLKSRDLLASDIAEMETAMEEVLLGGVDLWEPYKDALLKLRSEQKTVLIREGRKDILSLGKNLRILNPFSWLLDSYYSHLDVEQIFTELTIKGESKVDMQHLITSKLSSSGELPDVIIASGPPGIGKTSLFRFMVHDWLSSQPTILGMENIELIIPVELRHVFSHSVKDLLKDEILHSVSQQLETDDMISALKNVSLLWLLDGYDEASNNTKKVIKEICKKFPDSRILITTRTEFRNKIEITLDKIKRTYLTLCVQGFSQSNVEECAKKLINVSVTDEVENTLKLQSFMDFCQRDNRISWDVFHVPLYITLIVILWLNNPDKVSLVKSRSALYCLLVDHIVQKLIERDSFNQLNQLKSLLQTKVNVFLDYLGCVLWDKQSD